MARSSDGPRRVIRGPDREIGGIGFGRSSADSNIGGAEGRAWRLNSQCLSSMIVAS
jgi:hypothetical protein